MTWRSRLRRVPGAGMLSRLYHFAFDRRYRRARLLLRRGPPNLFQPYSTTADDRYPVIFRFVRDALGDAPSLRLLSFGCSTGEEVFTLRRYFPRSIVRGIDIDPANIAICERRLRETPDRAVSFAVASSTANEDSASFDAIFCMAVLRHGDLKQAERSDRLLRFEDFERAIADFARCLKPGGYLALRHANFRFVDSDAARGFDPVLEVPTNPQTPLFGRDNQRLAGSPHGDGVFRKR
jgi:SAM-dependent methyltransferase